MIRIISYILLALSLFASLSPTFAQSVYVPMDHWVYDVLERCETMYLFRALEGRALPMTRMEIARILRDIDENLTAEETRFTKTLTDQVDQLKGEFHEEWMKLGGKPTSLSRERHLLTWSEGDNIIHADADLAQTINRNAGDSSPSSNLTSHTTLGGILRGGLGNSLGFYLFARNTIHRGTEITQQRFDPSQGRPIGVAGKNVYSDEAAAYFVWKAPWFELQFGRDQLKWGPGYRGSLMLSAQNPLFDMIKLKAAFRRFRFISVHGFLNSGMGRKYLAAHRLEIRVAPWLFVAGSESVVYGGRGIEVQYLNPIMPYHVAEHHLGDKDNNTMGFDVTAFPARNVKCYFELFLDDFNLSKNPFTYYGNKFAFLVGGLWVHPFQIQNTDLRFEYARIEPYVYTHRDSINVYSNYDQPIGHWLGPNADDWLFEWNIRPHRDVRLTLSYESIRRGAGGLDQPHDPAGNTQKQFLNGVVEKQHHIGLCIVAQVFRDAFVTLGGYRILTKNPDREPGADVADTRFALDLWLNY